MTFKHIYRKQGKPDKHGQEKQMYAEVYQDGEIYYVMSKRKIKHSSQVDAINHLNFNGWTWVKAIKLEG
jgi:hypothetical protein